jgi:hypothetical protein
MTRMTHSPIRGTPVGSRAMGPPGTRREAPGVAPRVAAVASLLAVLFVAAGLRPAGGQTAPPIVGQYRAITTVINDDAADEIVSAIARCEPGDYVLGGGAHATGHSLASDHSLSLGQMQPVGAPEPRDGRHGFWAIAQEIPPGTSSDWMLTAYAVCASEPVPGHRIVTAPATPASSSSVKETAAPCGAGRVALGAGARLIYGVHDPEPLTAGLHVVRPSASGATTMVTAKEWPGGYSGDWQVKAYAICAHAPQGYEVRHTTATGRLVTATCTGDRHVLGAGGVADGPLTAVVPTNRGSDGALAEAPRNGAQSGFIAAYATCADTVPAPPPPPPPPPPPCPPQLPNCQEP